ncbi:MAG: hypothetical protein HFH53_05805 [Hespellia sp.]|nr:hypothetical protein [Hespellia sp.]
MGNDRRERYERFKQKQRKKLGLIIAGVFTVSVLVLSIAGILKPDVKFSEEENRMLAEKPQFSVESVQSESYMQNMEAYTADQFILRDWWVSLKVRCDLLFGKREFNGVYLGKDKYLMKTLTEPDEKNVKANLEAISDFADRNSKLDMHLMLVPNAAFVMKDYLPSGAPVRDQSADLKWIQKQLSANISCIDVTRALKRHAEEGVYYKTDHHWTSRGASYGFEAASIDLGIEEPVEQYDIYTVATDFSGTLASTSGYHSAKDTIEIYVPKNIEIQYLVSDSDQEEKRPTVYNKSALKQKDKYQVFFGGNHALVDITTANETKDRLLIFKDSYANCFVPFLLPYYNEIVMVDPRYYYDNVEALMSSKGITDVLFLYNMDTFLTDNSIADVLVEE